MGLVNGANGVIKDIVYPIEKSQHCLPSAIFVEFKFYKGPKFFLENDDRKDWIPINPLTAYNNTHNCSRTQLPIRLAYALTIHKSQGQTIDKAVIDLGKSEQSLGLTFVALSRLRNFRDFLIYPFALDRLNKISQSTSLQPRLKEEARIRLLIQNTLNEFAFLNL
jgi:ATP-dependent DNA helicase PIF1